MWALRLSSSPTLRSERFEDENEAPHEAFARSFWMMPVSSTIVIMNLIANLPFLYHKAENRGDLH
jgi:hypothetical protein